MITPHQELSVSAVFQMIPVVILFVLAEIISPCGGIGSDEDEEGGLQVL